MTQIEMILAVLKGFLSGSKPHRDVRPRETPEFLRKKFTPVKSDRPLPPNVRPVNTGPELPKGNFTPSSRGNRANRFRQL